MERTIRVTGTGRVSIKPNTTIINLNFDNVLPTYDAALRSSAEDVAIVKDALLRAGLSRDSLKTTNFDINTHHESYRDEKGNYKSRFDGYQYRQSLRFKFSIDNKTLGKVLYQLGQLDVNPEFSIYYSIEDAESAKNELLGNAIADAKKKAEVIANASGVALEEILDINYSWIDVELRTRSYNLHDEVMMCKSAPDVNGTYDIDIEPDDIDKTDSVTITFKIK